LEVSVAEPLKNNPRVIFGWAMYDWANSAYFTTTAAGLLPAYFADGIVPAGGYELFGRVYDGQTLWGYLIGFGTFIIFLITPILGAIADFSAAKKRFLQVFAYGGALFATSFVFVGTGDVLLTMGLFFLTQIGFVSANVFYDGFLPDITTPNTIDQVSAKGYAFGYIGGGLQFAIASLLVAFHGALGFELITATRIALAMAGLWWLGFAAFAFTRLRETGEAQELLPEYAASPSVVAYTKVGFGRVWGTARKLIGFKQLLLFLIAYMVYNDGVQTIINMASVYAKDTLSLSTPAIMTTFLIVQFVAFGGAYFFGWVAGRIQARPAVLICLSVYALVAVAAYFLPTGEAVPFFALGAVIGFVQGGAQSLSRSLYGSMIPEQASAEFYGFYSVLSKFSAIWGPLMFAMLTDRTGSGRNAILSLIVFFLVGGILLAVVNIEEARASRLRWVFEGAEAKIH
jgi:UMF1 family MFS transporter